MGSSPSYPHAVIFAVQVTRLAVEPNVFCRSYVDFGTFCRELTRPLSNEENDFKHARRLLSSPFDQSEGGTCIDS